MRIPTPTSDDGEEVWNQFLDRWTRHLDGLRGVLPDHVIGLAELRGVDDGLIVEARHDRDARALRLTLRCGDLQIGYFDLIVDYRDADMTPGDATLLARLARGTIDHRRHEADLHRQEVDVVAPGGPPRVVHRLEFHAPGGGYWEFSVTCAALDWQTVPRPDRTLPALPDRFTEGPLDAGNHASVIRPATSGRDLRRDLP